MKIILTHEYYWKFRQHNGRVVKTGTVPSSAPRSTLKPRGFWQWGFSLFNSHAGEFSHILILLGFQINHSWYSPNFTSITTNKYRPRFVDEGRIYIYISISLLFQHIYNFYNAYTTYTSNVQLIQRLYKRCTMLI